MARIIERVADRAQYEIDKFYTQAMLQSRRTVPVRTGYCAYCGEQCTDKFCDHDCMADWEREQRLKKIRGE